MKEEVITNTELINATYDANAFYHLAFQPKYPNYTLTRACVTVTPPPTTELGDEHRVCDRFIVTTYANYCVYVLKFKQVYIKMDVTNETGVYAFFYNDKQVTNKTRKNFDINFQAFPLCQMFIPHKGGVYRSTYRKIILPSKNSKDTGEIVETKYIQFLR